VSSGPNNHGGDPGQRRENGWRSTGCGEAALWRSLEAQAGKLLRAAEDALIAALKVKTEYPEAVITYVRQQNRRGDARHPSHGLSEDKSLAHQRWRHAGRGSLHDTINPDLGVQELRWTVLIFLPGTIR
jgi:hypothetical protein